MEMIKEARFLDIKNAVDRSQFGHRVLTTRRWLRGCSRSDIDCWLPDAGPSLTLLEEYRKGTIDWTTFSERYIAEQRTATSCRVVRYVDGGKVSDVVEQRSPLMVLHGIEEAHRMATVICWEDTETECHRHLLVAMANEEVKM
jgi:uncharacterized protein YeaO (DUF488 family)